MTPRLTPLPREGWTEPLTQLLSRMPGGVDRPLNVFTTLSRHPELTDRWIPFGAYLLNGQLPARDRELAILRISHHCRCAYERTHHKPGARAAGLTAAEIEATTKDIKGYPWSEADTWVLRAADELHADATLSDATWTALAARYTEAQLIEMVVLIGQYNMLAFALNALRIEVESTVDEPGDAAP